MSDHFPSNLKRGGAQSAKGCPLLDYFLEISNQIRLCFAFSEPCKMSRISVPFTGISTQRQTRQTLTDKQLGLVSKLAEECELWERRGYTSDDFRSSNSRRAGSQFVAEKFNSNVEAELSREAEARNKEESRGIAEFRNRLPVAGMREELLAVVKRHQVVVVSGETGCGKTTQVGYQCLCLYLCV